MSASDEIEARILAIATLPDEEAAEAIVLRVERLHQALDGVTSNILGLMPMLQAIVVTDPATLKATGATGSLLCDTCAVAADCGKKGEDVERCADYREKSGKCLTCAWWDTVACVGSNPCRGGSAYEAQSV